MTPRQIELVQSTWQQVVPIRAQAGALFYERLFGENPQLRGMFPADIAPQAAKLMAMLHTAVNALTDLDTAVPVLRELGRRHVAYGVRAEHYDPVGAALLWTLAQGLGPAFTDPVREAWTAAYALVAQTMQDGAAEA